MVCVGRLRISVAGNTWVASDATLGRPVPPLHKCPKVVIAERWDQRLTACAGSGAAAVTFACISARIACLSMRHGKPGRTVVRFHDNDNCSP